MRLKPTVLLLCLLGLMSSPCPAAVPDFGQDGLKGLDASQVKKLANGEIVFTFTDSATQAHSGLIEAAVVFNQTPEQTWNLLSRTEDQAKYLKELEEARKIAKSPLQDTIEFKVKAAFLTFVYRVNHNFDRSGMNFWWALDPTFKNDLVDLRGYWRFYPYGQGRTLARYGSTVSLKKVPAFIEDMFKKSGVARSLASVKRYVDSGGTYHK
ncbi:MAG TPA: SRPBCC family protein [Deltaproteobacteria bacterium]|nr:SRPBCC family protein [Deltaproteobacteria bacterium]